MMDRTMHEGDSTQHTTALRMMSLTLLAATCFLQACGGGGDEAGSPPPSPAPTTSTPSQAGDFYSFQTTTTTTVPSGTPSSTVYSTTAFRTVNGDGSNERVATYANSVNTAVIRNHTASGAMASYYPLSDASATCTYSPAFQTVPSTPRGVGQAWSQDVSLNCASGSTQAISTSGVVQATEDVSLPLYIFPTYRAVRTAAFITSSGGITSHVETCWYATVQVVNVRCVLNTSFTPLNGSTPTSVTSQDTRLIAFGGPTKGAHGSTAVRFAGSWRVTFSGGSSGTCTALVSPTTFALTGTCTVGGSPLTISGGSVSASGSLTATLSNGGTLTGTLTSTTAGTGTWAGGGNTGTWSAGHL